MKRCAKMEKSASLRPTGVIRTKIVLMEVTRKIVLRKLSILVHTHLGRATTKQIAFMSRIFATASMIVSMAAMRVLGVLMILVRTVMTTIVQIFAKILPWVEDVFVHLDHTWLQIETIFAAMIILATNGELAPNFAKMSRKRCINAIATRIISSLEMDSHASRRTQVQHMRFIALEMSLEWSMFEVWS